jgi:hypothetical protein
LQIERDLGTYFLQPERPGDGAKPPRNATKFLARKHDSLIDDGIFRQERFPTLVHEPRDSGVGQELLQRGGAGDGVDNVAEGARFDEQERLQLR